MAQFGRHAVGYARALIPATTLAAAGTTTGGVGAGAAWLLKGLEPYDRLEAVLNVTAAATEAGDTLDVYLDTTFDEGTVWVNIAHFTQLLGTGGAKREALVIAPGAATGTTPTNVAADAASGAVRHLLGGQLRARTVVADVVTTANVSFTFSLTVQVK